MFTSSCRRRGNRREWPNPIERRSKGPLRIPWPARSPRTGVSWAQRGGFLDERPPSGPPIAPPPVGPSQGVTTIGGNETKYIARHARQATKSVVMGAFGRRCTTMRSKSIEPQRALAGEACAIHHAKLYTRTVVIAPGGVAATDPRWHLRPREPPKSPIALQLHPAARHAGGAEARVEGPGADRAAGDRRPVALGHRGRARVGSA